MSLIVQKFGGDALGDKGKGKARNGDEPLFGAQFIADKFAHIAQIVKRNRDAGHNVIVVVSAMGDATNRLIAMANSISGNLPAREMDMLMATGEQQSIALMAIALEAAGVPACSMTGSQVGIITENVFGKARIRDINATRLEKAIEEGRVPVVAGFQGATEELEFTTLGRGGSDITAVAIAAAIKADLCEFYKDVDGIFTTDPRVCADAHKIDRISYDEMLELASLGAGVLQSRSVEFAKNYNVPLHVRSYLHDGPGTFVIPEEKEMEDVVVSGVAFNRAEAKVEISGLPDRPGIAADVFGRIGEANIVVDMIIQDSGADGLNDITFTVNVDDYDQALDISKTICKELGGREVIGNKDIAKVSAVGVGMRSHANVASRMFKALAEEGINIQMISTSEIKVSCVINADDLDRAVQAIHKAFQNDKKAATV
ncbi:MAG: aspartate kinase [Candidatus Sumerlaeia bacterium]|nr:aspartate kinase [Candidatus Sumerlaeia bacterium]